MFLNPNNFFQFEFLIFQITDYEKPPGISQNSILLRKNCYDLSVFEEIVIICMYVFFIFFFSLALIFDYKTLIVVI